MDAIHLILIIGIWALTVFYGKQYLKQRDDFIKSEEKAQPVELKKARNSFLSCMASAILYTIIKLL